MSNQGTPLQRGDGWWHEVYTGPAATLPDALAAPDAAAEDATVDEWFDSAVGMIGAQRTTETEAVAEPGPEAEAEAEDATAGEGVEPAAVEPTVDEWFDSALGMIGPQRVAETSSDGPAEPVVPVVAEAGPDVAAEPVVEVAPEPVAEPEAIVEPDPEPVAVTVPQVAEPTLEPEVPPVTEPESEPVATVEPDPEPVVPSAEVSVPPLTPPARRAFAQQPVPHVGERPPTYGPEPTAVTAVEPDELDLLTPDTVVDGAQYGGATVRAVSVRGDSARYRGEGRRDALLLTRFGEGEDGLLLAVVGTTPEPSPLAAEACRQLAAAVGRSRAELAADLRAGARDRLRYGLQRLTTGAFAPLRAPGAPQDAPQDAALHCLMISLDPTATHRAAFGLGPGGLYLLRSGHWIDAYAARLLHHPDGQLPHPVGPHPRAFRFRLVPATSGDILLLCTPGLADPLAEEPSVAHFLANHWAHPHPPGTVDFLRQIQVRAKGYASDRTAVALWTE
ncbi:hypothetical protein ACIA8O_18265 [Kitasatospora sp. NPDC051853]|uniref:hypothetical protein n=1 Tax=Kitasatospora sp. NPDC051853 TaxID=3364058 RepID=UPI0037B17E21